MKYLNTVFAATLLAGLLLTSCAKDNKDVAQQVVPQDVLNKIADMGFSTENVQIIEEGYLVEGDIVLTKEDLGTLPTGVILRVAETEQYHTTNLVTSLPRTITVSTSGSISTNLSNAVDAAIARYNAENLALTFQRVASGGNINVKLVNTRQYIASAGFPSGGNPYGEVKFAKAYQNFSLNFVTTVIAHEVGHCIGFRHTDYMDRSFSCGGSPTNEGASTVGAIHIPGTPTGPDANSWMLACLSSTTNRPFNANDVTALNYLY